MNRQLILLRHADAIPSPTAAGDFERILSQAGILDAANAASEFAPHITEPSIVISSRAVRARSTALIIASVFNFPFEKIVMNEFIYMADELMLLHVVNHLSQEFQTAILVGHNPAISKFASYLDSDQSSVNLAPAGFCRILFGELSWDSISRNSGALAH